MTNRNLLSFLLIFSFILVSTISCKSLSVPTNKGNKPASSSYNKDIVVASQSDNASSSPATASSQAQATTSLDPVSPSTAMFWFQPMPYQLTLNSSTGLFENRYTARPDYVSNITNPNAWSEVRTNTQVFGIFINVVNVLSSPALTQLASYVKTAGLKVNIELGGLRPQKISGINEQCTDAAATATLSMELRGLAKWVQAGGTVDFITIDNAFSFSLDTRNFPGVACNLPLAGVAEKFANFVATVKGKYPNASIGFTEGLGATNLPSRDGFLYKTTSPDFPAYSSLNPSHAGFDFEELVTLAMEKTRAKGARLDFFFIDFWDGVHADAQHYSNSTFLETIRYSTAQGQRERQVDLGRILAAESILKRKDIKVGLHINAFHQDHIDGNLYAPTSTEQEGNRSAHERTLEFLRIYLENGGNPHFFNVQYWHPYPAQTGPESTPYTALNSARESFRMIHATAPAPAYEGSFELLSCSGFSGWVWDKNQPNRAVSVTLFSDGSAVTSLSANLFRADLSSKGNGNHGFSSSLPTSLLDGREHQLQVSISGTTQNLVGGPKKIGPCYPNTTTPASCSVSFNPSSNVVTGSNVVATITSSNITSVKFSLNGGQEMAFSTVNGSQTFPAGSPGDYLATSKGYKADGTAIACGSQTIRIVAAPTPSSSCSVNFNPSTNIVTGSNVVATITSSNITSVKFSLNGGQEMAFSTVNGTQTFPAGPPGDYLATSKGYKADGTAIACGSQTIRIIAAPSSCSTPSILPAGLFMINTAIFYSNGSTAFCVYPDWATYQQMTGRNDVLGIPKYLCKPQGMRDGGSCRP